MTGTKRQQKGSSSPKPRATRGLLHIIVIVLILRVAVIQAYIVPTGSMDPTIKAGDFIIGNQFVYGIRTPDWIGIPWTQIGFKIPYTRLPGYEEPRAGDVVIFRYPNGAWPANRIGPFEKNLNYVKRLVAGPGQTLEIRDKTAYIDGIAQDDPVPGQLTRLNTYREGYSEAYIFPRGLGNRDHYGPLRIPAVGDTLWFDRASRDHCLNVMSLEGRDLQIDETGNIRVDGHSADHYVCRQDHYFFMGDNRDNSHDSRYWGLVPADHIMGEAILTWFSWDQLEPDLLRRFLTIRPGRMFRFIS